MPRPFLFRLALSAALLGVPVSAQTLTPSKPAYALSETVSVTYSDVSRDLGDPYVVLVPDSARDDQDGSLHTTYLSSFPGGTLSFKGVRPGRYEARLYYASAVTGVIARTSLVVAGPASAPAAPRAVAPPAATPPAPAAPPAKAPATPARARPQLSTLLGSWQCMSRQQRADDLMFTFTLRNQGVWTNLTFRPRSLQDARYAYNAGTGVLRLNTPAGTSGLQFEYIPAGAGSKERLAEILPETELYRAQVCYRFKP